MIAALLFAAQLTLPESMIPPAGEIHCTADYVICWQRYADAAASVTEHKLLEVQLEAAFDEIQALRAKLDEERAKKKVVTCAKIEKAKP